MGHWETSPEPAVQFEHFLKKGPKRKGSSVMKYLCTLPSCQDLDEFALAYVIVLSLITGLIVTLIV